MQGGGFGAPAGGFGKAPVGGFGAPAADGFGAPAGGFGKAPASGGFGGAPAAQGFGAPAGGFGKAPAAGGFGAPATGGFGAPAAGGFGAPAAGGFGKAPVGGGFGAPTPQQSGFGAGGFGSAPPPTGGFGGGGFGQAQQQSMPTVPLDPMRQSTIVRYLLEIDNAYNGLHPSCKFRTFLYNMCTPGLGDQAIARERYAAANAGGGCREEDWIAAQRSNPDPENMYPHPIHFFQGLKQRVDKQVSMFETFHKHMDTIEEQVRELEDLQESNASEHAKLQLDQTMLERRWMAVAAKVEVVRQLGLPIGDERSALYDRTQQLLQQIRADGKFASAASELDNLLDIEAASAKGRSQGGSTGLTSRSGMTLVEPHVLKDWRRFLEHLQDGIERLRHVMDNDVADVKSAKTFLMGKQASHH